MYEFHNKYISNTNFLGAMCTCTIISYQSAGEAVLDSEVEFSNK